MLPQRTYIYRVPQCMCMSSELGLPHPISRKRVCPLPPNQRVGAHTPAGEGVGESHFRRLEKAEHSAYSVDAPFPLGYERWPNQTTSAACGDRTNFRALSLPYFSVNSSKGYTQAVPRRCRLSWLTNSALVHVHIWVQMRGEGEGGSCWVSANKYSCMQEPK
jgi:hypothetical protein